MMRNKSRFLLKVNLSTGKIERERLDSNSFEQTIGGIGLEWMLMRENLRPDIDPFSPENPITFSAGSLVGTLTPGAAHISATTVFPTIASMDGKHFIASGASGSRRFGLMLRNSGYDCVLITGKAPKPVYLEILDDEVSLRDAHTLWGEKDAIQTIDELKAIYGQNSGIVSIGPAGENKVRYAMAMVDKSGTLGRGGVGAVMGSKNLKAIVARGTKGIPIEDRKRFMKTVRRIQKRIETWPLRDAWSKVGIGAGWPIFKDLQNPGKWPMTEWDGLFNPERYIQEGIFKQILPCSSCFIGCKSKFEIVGDDISETIYGEGGYFAKIATSMQLLDVKDFKKGLLLYSLANRAGICFYTLCRMLDFVTTCYSKGELRGLDLEHDKLTRDFDTYISLFKKIVTRKGIGDLLAEGWLGLQKETGLDPQDYWYAGICKGTDFVYDVRAAKLTPLMMTFFTNPRPHHGGNHTVTTAPLKPLNEIKEQVERWGLEKETIERIFTDAPYSANYNIGRYTRHMEDAMMVNNSLGICSLYTGFGLIFGDDLAELYSSAMGIEVTSQELMKKGERTFTIKKFLNMRQGFTKEDDQVPELWLRPLDTKEGREFTKDYYGRKVLNSEDFEALLRDYYDERGWDVKTGQPKPKNIKEMDPDAE